MVAMDKLARILAIVLLAAFAASTVAHAANVTRMSLAMSPATMAGGDMDDCEGCPPGDDGKVSLCGQVCFAPFAAIPAAAGIELPLVTVGVASCPLQAFDGLASPPDPSPPRTIIL
jgi:hypothetical protein